MGIFYAEVQFAFAEASASVCPYTLARNMKIGSTGDDVLKLQQFLNASSDTSVASNGIGSPGKETRTYGALTAKAVAKFQEKYKADILSPLGLTKGTGSVFGLTRAKLNALCKAAPPIVLGVSTGEPATEQDVLTIARAERQPPLLIAPKAAWTVPFTNVTLTAGNKDVTVESITVERTGPAADGAFASVVITDEDRNYIGRYKTLNSNHQVTLGEPFVIPAGTSQTITVMGNMNTDLTDYEGQVAFFQIVAVKASSPIAGALPIMGTGQTLNNTLEIGAATAMLSQFDPNTDTNRYINDTGVRFSGIRITANSKEPLLFNSITWDQSGTAGNTDLANVVTIINNIEYPTEVDGKYYTATFDPPVRIGKGESIDVYVRGDLLTSGVNRTVKFDVRKSDDVWLTGGTYGFDVGVPPEANTATAGNSIFTTSDGTTDGTEIVPYFSGSVATIKGGTATTIEKR